MISKVPYAEPSYMQGFHSPYYNESHHKFRAAVREFFEREVLEEAAQFEEAGKPASQAVYEKIGSTGFFACRLGPGSHLNLFKSLPGGVDHKDFTYYHEQIIHEEISRFGYPGYQVNLDYLKVGFNWNWNSYWASTNN